MFIQSRFGRGEVVLFLHLQVHCFQALQESDPISEFRFWITRRSFDLEDSEKNPQNSATFVGHSFHPAMWEDFHPARRLSRWRVSTCPRKPSQWRHNEVRAAAVAALHPQVLALGMKRYRQCKRLWMKRWWTSNLWYIRLDFLLDSILAYTFNDVWCAFAILPSICVFSTRFAGSDAFFLQGFAGHAWIHQRLQLKCLNSWILRSLFKNKSCNDTWTGTGTCTKTLALKL